MFKLNKRETVDLMTGDSIITNIEIMYTEYKIFDADFWYDDKNAREGVYIWIDSENVMYNVKDVMNALSVMRGVFDSYIESVYDDCDCEAGSRVELIDKVIPNIFRNDAENITTYLWAKDESGNVYPINVAYTG